MNAQVSPPRPFLPSLAPGSTVKRKLAAASPGGALLASEFGVAPSPPRQSPARGGASASLASDARSVSITRKSVVSPPRGLPKLDAPDMLIPSRYTGPTEESNWLIPGHLMIGAYPADTDDLVTEFNLVSIMKLGIGVFVSLQEEYDPSPDVTEEMWRMGLKIRPYFRDVQRYYQCPIYWRDVKRPDQIEFIHFPIRDLSASASDHDLFQLCKSLLERLDQGQKVYVHCWGGHGRAGTVACILLAMAYGVSADAALVRVQQAHDLRKQHLGVASPQTIAQRAQVRRIIDSSDVKSFFRDRERALASEMRKDNSDSPQSILSGGGPASSTGAASSSSPGRPHPHASSPPHFRSHQPATPSPEHPQNARVEIPTPMPPPSSPTPPPGKLRSLEPPSVQPSAPSTGTPSRRPHAPLVRAHPTPSATLTPSTVPSFRPVTPSSIAPPFSSLRSPLTARTTRWAGGSPASSPYSPAALPSDLPTPIPPRTARTLGRPPPSFSLRGVHRPARSPGTVHASSVTPTGSPSIAASRTRYSQRSSVSPHSMRVLSPY